MPRAAWHIENADTVVMNEGFEPGRIYELVYTSENPPVAGLGMAAVRDLARITGLSERQIHRRCTAAFGYGPAVLTRMLRLRRVLRLARAGRPPLRLAGLATAAGYYDQQHLAREVRAIMGTTPTDLLRPA